VLSCASLTGSGVTMKEEGDVLVLSVSVSDRLALDTVIKLELDREINQAF